MTSGLQLAVIVTPALMMTVMLTSSPRQTLLLRLPRWPAIPAAVLLAVALHPVVNLLQTRRGAALPAGAEVQEVAGKSRAAPGRARPVASAPAAGRGAGRLRGTGLPRLHPLRLPAPRAPLAGHRPERRLLRPRPHCILQQSLLACLLGVVLGLLAVQTGSLLPGVLFHLVHNSLVLVLSRCAPLWVDRWPILRKCVSIDPEGGVSYSWPVIVAGSLVAALLLAWFLRLPSPKSPEEELEEAIHRGSQNPEPEP